MRRKRMSLRLDVPLPASRISWILAAALLACASPELGSENVTLSTYYPAPSGVYTQMLTTQNTFLARDGGNVGIGTGSPSAKLEVAGQAAFDQAAVLKNAGYAQGGACAPEGAVSYDYTNHALIYCGRSGKWQSPGVTVGASPLLLSNNGKGPSRGSPGWWIGNDGSGFSGGPGVVVQNIGAGRNCVAVLATVGESDDVGNQPAFACRYDPKTGNVVAQTHDHYDASCVWICAN